MKKRVLVALFIVLGMATFAGGASGGELIEERLSFSGIERLAVEGSFFDVEITGSSTTAIEAVFAIPERLHERGVKVEHEIRGSELRVWVERKIASITSPPWSGPRMIFTVPADTYVNVKNSSGSVTVQDIETEELSFEVSSGSLKILNCSAVLNAASSSGNIRIEACVGEKVLSASSGNITVLDSNGDIEADSTSGKHHFEGIEGSLDAQSSSGGISVEDFTGRLDLQSNSGRLSGTEITATGDSSFETSSGSINIDFLNPETDFTFELRSSSGTISAGGTRAKGTVVTGSGGILVKGKSSSGNQSYR